MSFWSQKPKTVAPANPPPNNPPPNNAAINHLQNLYAAQAQNMPMYGLGNQIGGWSQNGVQQAVPGHTLEWMVDIIVARVAAASLEINIDAIRAVVREELDRDKETDRDKNSDGQVGHQGAEEGK